MKKIIYLFVLLCLLSFASCKKKEISKVSLNLYHDDELLSSSNYDKGTNIVIDELSHPTIDHYNFTGWYDSSDTKVTDFTILEDTKLYAKYEFIPFVEFKINGSNSIVDGTNNKFMIEFVAGSTIVKPTYSVDKTDIADVTESGRNFCWVEAYQPGSFVLTASYKDFVASINVTVTGATYNLTYKLNEEEVELLIDAPTSYNTAELPFNLPTLEKEGFFFNGWKIGGIDGIYNQITFESGIWGDLELSPIWSYPHLDFSYEKEYPIIGIDEIFSLNVTYYELPDSWGKDYKLTSGNESVVVIEDNKIKGVGDGYAEVLISLKDHDSVNISFGITVRSDINTMNELLAYFGKIAKTPIIAKEINVITWQLTWKYDLLTSVVPYLFEDLDIVENIAPLTIAARPGTKRQKYYVCVHDTADLAYGAEQWSRTVYNGAYDNGDKYEASFQYVVGNDGIYHNIPDDEVAWHAGDGTRVQYTLYPTGVYGTEKHPAIGISTDGYYTIDGKKTTIVAPTDKGKILTTSVINDYGIRCVLSEDNEYLLGASYYNTDYRRISNYAGNNNSIGIESCVNSGTDVFYTWQKLAKLVAYLLDENNLTIDDVVPHHYFSGKDCPITMRRSNMWFYFKDMIMMEYHVREYLKQGYKITFEPLDTEYINSVGRIIKWPKESKTVSFRINISKDEIHDSITLGVTILGSNIQK